MGVIVFVRNIRRFSKRWTIFGICCLLLAGCAGGPQRPGGPVDHRRAAEDAWRQNDLEHALAQWELVVAANADDADAHAWLAEALRRHDEFEPALAQARLALSLVPEHAFALAVLGDLCNPQFRGDAAYQNQEVSLRMYRASLEIDPHDPQSLAGLCTWAIRTGDREGSSACLNAMDASGLWSGSIISLARWMLESAPLGAILLVNGDLDAFPIWMLQERGIRTDVLICHISLINTKDYLTVLGASGLPLPDQPPEWHRGPGGKVVSISRQVVEHLLDLDRRGDLGRPLAVATTVDSDNLPEDMLTVCDLRGGVWLHRSASERGGVDLEATRKLLDHVLPEVVSGTWITDRERSPVRLKSGEALRYNPMNVTARALDAATVAGEFEMAAWFRERYLAYRRLLGAYSFGDAIFEKCEAKLTSRGR